VAAVAVAAAATDAMTTATDTTTTRGLSHPQHLLLRVAGAGLLAAVGAIHLDLYLTGYSSIPVIGPLFLFQVVAAFVLAIAVLVSASPVVAAAAALFPVATLGGYILSLWVGLFGFKEVRTTAGIAAGVIEVAAFAVLAVAALMAPSPGIVPRVAGAGRAVAGASVVALIVLGVAVGLAGGPAAAQAGSLKAADIGGKTVLTNAKGFTLYLFAPDTPNKSNCNGSCASYWPPVTGTPTAGSGVTGRIGTIKRAGGAAQATYNGHPLYTYVGDSGPGQANGNGVNLNGGLWYAVPASG
jgi:predicted lipoprotein with Yx(FWY)xxD motif